MHMYSFLGQFDWMCLKEDIYIVSPTMDEATKSKQDSMLRYGKHKWSKLHIEGTDTEFRLHLENMLFTDDVPRYWEMQKDRIRYLLDIRPEHVKNLHDSIK